MNILLSFSFLLVKYCGLHILSIKKIFVYSKKKQPNTHSKIYSHPLLLFGLLNSQ